MQKTFLDAIGFEPPRVRKTSLTVTGKPLVWVAAIMVVYACLPNCKKADQIGVKFSVRHPTEEELARVLESDRKNLANYQPASVAKTVEEAFFRFNATTVFSKHRLDQIEQVMRNLEMAVKRCLEDEGRDSLKLLAYWLLERFEERLQVLVLASRKPAVAKALVAGVAPSGQAQEVYMRFVEVAGDFLTHAVKSGLVRLSPEKGIELNREASFFIRLAFKVRWSRILPDSTQPLSWLFTGFEREWYDVWVAERSLTAGLQRRLGAIKRLSERDPDYSDQFARGIVYYQNRQYKKAVNFFSKALEKDPRDKRISSFLAAAKRKAG